MNTVAEITDALPKLNNEELRAVERALISIYQQRRTGIIYDDAYGVWTEEDQMSVADQAFVLMEAEEKKAKKT
ncbi:MAG: hypothetical protein ACR2H1_06860 [Limisphaerales bacterium]